MDKNEATIAREQFRCPVELTLSVLTSKWKILIIRTLMVRRCRFGELRHALGSVSQKVLTASLRELESDGLVNREVFAEVPPRVEYELTDLGRSLRPVISSMFRWGLFYRQQMGMQGVQLDDEVLEDLGA